MLGVAPNTTRLEPLAPLEALPNEVLYRIVIKLDLHDLCSLRKCSKTLRDFVASADKIWQSMAQEFGWRLLGNPSLFENLVKAHYTQCVARDVLCVWNKMAECLEVEIEQPSQFDAWMDKHQEDLNDLTRLNLSNLNLTHLPKQICRLKGLNSLKADHNQLRRFPSQLSQLRNLTHLHLENNQIRELPAEFPSFPVLINLNIGENCLCRFPNQLCKLEELTHLTIDGPLLKLGPAGPLTLPPRLKINKHFFETFPEEVLDQIALQLGYPTDILHRKDGRTLAFYIDKTIKECENLLETNYPDEIYSALLEWGNTSRLPLAEIKLLIDFKRGADAVVTQKALAKLLKEPSNLDAPFSQWIQGNKAELASLPVIDLLSLGSTELPPELFTPALIGKIICNPQPNWQDKTSKLIAAYLDSPINDCEHFILHLVRFRSNAPADIMEILKPGKQSLAQLQFLHQWVKARNTLDIWGRLCEQLGVDRVEGCSETAQAEIDAAAKFQDWCKKNQAKLSGITSLDLSDLKLFSLPPQIGLFTGLQNLNLAKNYHLVAVPKVIWELRRLKELDLQGCAILDLEEELPKLGRLETLTLPSVRNPKKIKESLVKIYRFTYDEDTKVYERN